MTGESAPVTRPLSASRAVARWQTHFMNLYRLDTGAYWMDDVIDNMQGTLTPEEGNSIVGNLAHPAQDRRYAGETYEALLTEYWSNGRGGETVDTLDEPFPDK